MKDLTSTINCYAYTRQVLDLIPAYEDFYANNGDFDNAAMLRHFATAIVAFNASESGTAANYYAVSDMLDLMPTIRTLIHEDESDAPQPLVLIEEKELSAPESSNYVVNLVLNITVNVQEAPAVKVVKDAICKATSQAKAVAYKLRLADKIKQIAGQEASNAYLAGAL